jgi:hypothetical protein
VSKRVDLGRETPVVRVGKVVVEVEVARHVLLQPRQLFTLSFPLFRLLLNEAIASFLEVLVPCLRCYPVGVFCVKACPISKQEIVLHYCLETLFEVHDQCQSRIPPP